MGGGQCLLSLCLHVVTPGLSDPLALVMYLTVYMCMCSTLCTLDMCSCWSFASKSGLAPVTVFILLFWSLISAVSRLRTSTHGVKECFLPTASSIFATQNGNIW